MLAAEDILNDPVAKHARRDFTILMPNWTVGEAMERMRQNPPPARVIYFYVVDETDKLLGVVPTRRLLFAPVERPISEIMITSVIAVPETATVLDACEFFTLHRFLAFPVVAPGKKLVGVIDVELYSGELAGGDQDEPSAAADVFELIGVHLSAAAQSNPGRAIYERFPWLLCNIGGGLAAAFLSSIYDNLLTARGAALALFIPVVLALSESVAMQSVTLRAARLKTSAKRKVWKEAVTEAVVGLGVGIASAALLAIVAGFWLGDITVAVVLLTAVAVGVGYSAVVGFTVPTLLHKLRWNPQVAAGPISLAAADLGTLLLYFNIARLLF